jgi:hypothetical protein
MAERTLFVGNPDHPSRVTVDPSTIDQPVLAELLSYWRARRSGRTVPQYSDFSPKDLTRHLSSLVVTDALPELRDFRYRLVGSRVTRYFLSDATGKTIREEFGGELGEFLTALNRQACVEGIPVRLTGPAAIIGNTLYPDYDTLYLPWATGHLVDKVVSVFVFDPGSLAARQVEATALPRELQSLRVASADELIRTS